MYWLNKIVWGIMNPYCLGLVVGGWWLVAGYGWSVGGGRRRSWRWVIGVLALVWMYVFSTNVIFFWQQNNLVKEFPPMRAEAMPMADAIVDLGGGMGANSNVYPYAEMSAGADRVWHAARLWKAGRASMVIPSGKGCGNADAELLRDLGVPREAIVVEDEARNTEENAKFVQRLLNEQGKVKGEGEGRWRILLVTSVWHMRRSLLMFEKYAPELEVIPAATDYEGRGTQEFGWANLIPSAENFAVNNVVLHELIGYWWYKWFR